MKDGLIKFSDKSREDLIEEILRLEKENEALKKKLKEQEQKEARKKELRFQRILAKAKRPKTPGQKAGHPGFTRIKPKTINRVVEQTLKYCPDCHHRLSQSQEVIEHIQEDIIPAHPQVTLFKKHRYWCRDCKKLVTAPYALDEIPHGNLGPNLLIQSVLLKYHHGLPFNKIEELFKGLCQFEVTEGCLFSIAKSNLSVAGV